MPRGNGMGPMAIGTMTERGSGYCTGFEATRYANPVGGRYGFGRNHGNRKMLFRTGISGWAHTQGVSEKEFLTRQAEFFGNQFEQVKKRLSEITEDSE